MSWFIFTLFLISMVCFSAAGQENPKILKLGTFAPEGSSWSTVFKEINSTFQKETKNTLKFKFYFGKDETDLIDLFNSRQLDAISMTSVGLGKLVPEFNIFQLPLLFISYQELDYVRTNLTAYFQELLSKKGWILLGWVDLGFIYLFSKSPIKTQTDLQKTRFWVWMHDPTSRAFASASGREPILLPFEDVLPSLKNNEIQTVYNSPMGCIVYQWYSEVNYMTNLPLAAGVGGTVMHRDRYMSISEKNRTLLMKIQKEYHEYLIGKIREDNEMSLDLLKKEGIQFISMPPREKMKWQQISVQVQNQFVGQLYDEKLLINVRKLLSEIR